MFHIDGEEGGPGVGPGLIGSTQIPIDLWTFNPVGVQGKMGAITRIANPVSGHGYLAVIHFKVIGSRGQSSSIAFSSFGGINKVDLSNGVDLTGMPYSFGAEQVRVTIE